MGLMVVLNLHPSSNHLHYLLCSINSYYGVFRFADSYHLRKDVYNNHFIHLQKFFYGAKWFEKIGVMKNNSELLQTQNVKHMAHERYAPL